MEIRKEYERIKGLFEGIDEKQMALIDGAIWECARLRVELNGLNEVVKKSGLVKIHPTEPSLQKELPVSKMVVKVRANYLNYIAKLSNILGKNIDDEDNDLEEILEKMITRPYLYPERRDDTARSLFRII